MQGDGEQDLLPADIRETYQVEGRHHACSILKTDFAEQWKDVIEVLRSFKLRRTDMKRPGGNKSPIAKGLNGLFFRARMGREELRYQSHGVR